MQQKITPFLWFDHNAEEAINHYLSIFKNAKVLSMNRYGPGAPMPAGTLLTATLQIEGQEFVLLNGGPHYTFSPAISFVINCTNQEEVDYYWNALKEGGEEQPCGWLVDKYGLSWQIVPVQLGQLLNAKDTQKAARVFGVMMGMKKIVIKDLEEA